MDYSHQNVDIKTNYKRTLRISAFIFVLLALVGLVLKGKDDFYGILIVGILYFLVWASSKSVNTIRLRGSTIIFEYYVLIFIKKEVIYERHSLYGTFLRKVVFRRGVHYEIIFYIRSDNKKIFELSNRDLSNPDDVVILKELFSNSDSSS